MTPHNVTLGIERFLAGEGQHLRTASIGLVAHPASVTRSLAASADRLLEAGFRLEALFGPQHGMWGEKQDNMVESAHFRDPHTGLPVHSLYGDVRRPTPDMLNGLDALLFDLQDVGVRVYTFVWTMALAMEACAEAGVRFVVLDRPNPVGGAVREGPILREGYESFVGLHPVPPRHGLTSGEMARWLVGARGIGCELEVIPCGDWRRESMWPDTGLPWVLPSPNLPTPDSCRVYPGMVLLEGTNLSEGRGTTRPFEIFGAPWLAPHPLVDALEAKDLPGVRFRPCRFEPTFQKHAGSMCGGAQIHVTDAGVFRPVRTAVTVLHTARALAPDAFAWRDPPYEYEDVLMPIDILWGHDGLRTGIETERSVDELMEGVGAEAARFARAVEDYLLYP